MDHQYHSWRRQLASEQSGTAKRLGTKAGIVPSNDSYSQFQCLESLQ
ncbi:unnamed protein product [Fusarium graminearum]|uniref:Chromosome 1, complete genome n=1 Tax=Gibberella zeae (strain ATCC MYA-4620 / CBS 123657 / FGSC 9075 / NRRL 31084 / PH-1) TaxID=229533 RepID=A0A098D1M1_GIBZE|nr:unnamed protein product [Fusarium graminearum]CZS76121.1 unnamed protein product [Fusarium graminearum]